MDLAVSGAAMTMTRLRLEVEQDAGLQEQLAWAQVSTRPPLAASRQPTDATQLLSAEACLTWCLPPCACMRTDSTADLCVSLPRWPLAAAHPAAGVWRVSCWLVALPFGKARWRLRHSRGASGGWRTGGGGGGQYIHSSQGRLLRPPLSPRPCPVRLRRRRSLAGPSSSSMGWALALHGGAGDVPRTLPPESREPRLATLRRCLDIGAAALREGRTALDVVELVVRPLSPRLVSSPIPLSACDLVPAASGSPRAILDPVRGGFR